MNITFLRQGHSNNSSSAHSLIFTNQAAPRSTESSEFGWDWFTCSGKEDKLNYLLICLRGVFWRVYDVGSNYRLNYYDDKGWMKIMEGLSHQEKKLNDSFFKEWLKYYFGYEFNISNEWAHVDHQSAIEFPRTREGDKIHINFAKNFIKEFVENDGWYVFGGNDNQEHTPAPPVDNEDSSFEEFREIWNMISDNPEVLCVFDEKTQEYVLSDNKRGGIMKIKF